MLKCAPGTRARLLPNVAKSLGIDFYLDGRVLEVKRPTENGPQCLRVIQFEPTGHFNKPMTLVLPVKSVKQIHA